MTFSATEIILEIKYISTSSIGETLPAVIYKITDINLMLKSLLPDEVKVNTTDDDNRLKSNLSTNETI